MGNANTVDRAQELMRKVTNRKAQLTKEERLELLHEMFDCALLRGVKCAVSGDSKFSSTAIALMDHALAAITAIGGEAKATAINLNFDIDLSDEDDSSENVRA